jgi:hypothetical protein
MFFESFNGACFGGQIAPPIQFKTYSDADAILRFFS